MREILEYSLFENGFTGLEAAIVLIAFVVVAAVFSYVVLGAGFFATQKSQEVVHTGVETASSDMQVVGNVYGLGNAGDTELKSINFSISLAPGGTPIDFEKVVITYSNATQLETIPPMTGWRSSSTAPGKWAITSVQNEIGTTNDLLEKGEQFTISISPSDGIVPNDAFSVDVKPGAGAYLYIRRTAPAAISDVNILF